MGLLFFSFSNQTDPERAAKVSTLKSPQVYDWTANFDKAQLTHTTGTSLPVQTNNSPGSERVSLRVLDVDDVEGSRVPLPRGDDADTTQVVSAGHHAHVACGAKQGLAYTLTTHGLQLCGATT